MIRHHSQYIAFGATNPESFNFGDIKTLSHLS
jgi:hypothetical protein